MEIVYTEEAILNLDDIHYYVAFTMQNPTSANRLVLAIRETIDYLADFPYMGEEQEQLEAGLRRLRHGNYAVLYNVVEAEKIVLIRNVLHSKQDIERRYRDP